MKCDMGGAATVTGSSRNLRFYARFLKKRTKLLLLVAQKIIISDHAYSLGDIITYKNGVNRVSIVNTDALNGLA